MCFDTFAQLASFAVCSAIRLFQAFCQLDVSCNRGMAKKVWKKCTSKQQHFTYQQQYEDEQDCTMKCWNDFQHGSINSFIFSILASGSSFPIGVSHVGSRAEDSSPPDDEKGNYWQLLVLDHRQHLCQTPYLQRSERTVKKFIHSGFYIFWHCRTYPSHPMMPGFCDTNKVVLPPDGMGLRKVFAEHGQTGSSETSFGYICQ